jgi:cystathionine beta-synthase
VGVDPVGSLYYDFVKTGRVTKPFTYKVEGIGEDFFPETIDLSVLDEIIRVDDPECFLMTRELVRKEGLYVGGSSGAAVAGALKYARQTQKKEKIIVLICDSAAKYMSKIFNDDWMRENGFLEAQAGFGTVKDVLGNKASQDVIVAEPSDKVGDVIARMKAHGISQLPVVENGKLVGAVNEIDMLRYLVSRDYNLDSPIGPLVESEYATVSPRTKVEVVQGLLNDARMAIVTDEEKVVGIVTKIDLIDFLARRGLTP